MRGRRIYSTFALVAGVALGPRIAAAQAGQQPAAAPSTFASVEVHINSRQIAGKWYPQDAGFSGPARIAITYGQPHARGRQVEGGLIPRDTVWRLGANLATTLHTDVDLTIGTLDVPRGDYSLFLLYTAAGWQLVVNRQTGQWGTDYDPSHDLGRTPITHHALADPVESLSIYLVPEWATSSRGPAALRGTLRIVWGLSALQTEWRVKT